MSIEATSTVWKTSKARGAARLVILCLANYTNKSGVAWPSVKTIADDTFVSERQVTRAIAELEESGEIEIIEKGDGRGRSTVYKIILKDDKASPFDQVEKDDTLSVKGDISSIKDDTLSVKGDTVSPNPIEPLIENHKEPLRVRVTPSTPFPFKPARNNPELSAADIRAQAIAEVCGMRMSVPRHRDRCNSAAAQLRDFTPEYITERFSSVTGYWRTSDWRGMKGNRPTPEQVVDEISTTPNELVYKPSTNGNGCHEKPVTIDPTMPKPGQGGVW